MTIAALLTCHNRRDTTVACLEALFIQCLPKDAALTIYLVDDGCTDGTAAAVMQRFPEVRIIPGDGNLYWCGGMRLAWAHAFRLDCEYYLWLNDDCVLLPGALASLLHTGGGPDDSDLASIAVGSTRDPVTGKTSYGGHLRGKVNRMLSPSGRTQECDLMNGNVVLIPRVIAKVVGNISPEFTHCFGDFDYSLRARRLGFHVTVAPVYAGECAANDGKFPCFNRDVPLVDRWRSLKSPKGIPLREIYLFCRRHNGMRWPIYILKLYLRVMVPRPWNWLKHIVGLS